MLLAFALLPLTPLAAILGGSIVVFVISATFFLLVVGFTGGPFWQVFVWSVLLSVGLVALQKGRMLLRAFSTTPRNPILDLETRGADEDLESTVRQLVWQVDLEMPRVTVVETDTPEAFTVRRRRDATATIAVSEGLIEVLDDQELEAVLAHEVSHLNDRDNVVMGWVTLPLSASDELEAKRQERLDEGKRSVEILTMRYLLERCAGACAGIIASGREFAADAGAAAITGNPAALASALAKLDDEIETRPTQDLRDNPEVAMLNVVPAEENRRFSTHPPTEKRIERLEEIAAESPGRPD